MIAEALEAKGLEIEPTPEGKAIEKIVVYVAPVFDHRDPIPKIFNIFHARTRDFIVAQEVLQQPGEVWNTGRILESERNLRSLRQLSLANIAPAKGSRPDRVVLLVVVKDTWSLRLNSSISFNSAGLDYLTLNPTEENLAGLRAVLGTWFMLDRDRYFVGANVGYPRLPDSRYSIAIFGGSFINRHTGEPEGGRGSFSFSLPQYSRHTPWAYGAETSVSQQTVRFYDQSGQLRTFTARLADGSEELVPWVYDSEQMSASYWAVRSFFVEHKVDVGWGLDLDHRRYRGLDSGVSAEAQTVFETSQLPTSDTRISPYVSLALYETRFLRTSEVETLGFQEDYQLGYGVATSFFVGAEALGSSRDLVGVRSNAGYTLAVGDGLFRIGASNRAVVARDLKNEGFLSISSRFVSPKLKVGRFHLDGYFGARYYDYLNVTPYRLGANNRLRGYPPNNDLHGKSIIAANAEFRTFGIDILSAQLGAAVFYDLGGVDDVVANIQLRQAAGVGLRLVFPQAARMVWRLDWGVPLSGDVPVFPGAFQFTFGQAFPMPSPSGNSSPFID